MLDFNDLNIWVEALNESTSNPSHKKAKPTQPELRKATSPPWEPCSRTDTASINPSQSTDTSSASSTSEPT